MQSDEQQVVAAQAPKPRIVQYDRRRYSIRLESVFWKFLEFLAERRGMRMGRYIAGLAGSYKGNNLSSYLRVVCMLEAERKVAESSLDPARDSLFDLVRDCPSPGLVVSRGRTILAYNNAFGQWLGAGGPRLLAGTELTEVLQLRTARALNEIWADMVDGRQDTVIAHVLHVSPGRISAAQATIVPLRSGADEAFHAVMWLEVKRPKAESLPGDSKTARGVQLQV
jgi:predicted DNA-binding ribbon-helix-helix protein